MKKSIELANNDDLVDTSRILTEATHWMQSQGYLNWNPEWWDVRTMAVLQKRRQLHMVKSGEQNVATFCLQQNDPEVWPDKMDNAFYLHRVAVDRAATGKGLPSLIIDWCKASAVDRGKIALRLDCAVRPKLIDLYRNLGFEFCSKIRLQEEGMPVYDGVKMELKL